MCSRLSISCVCTTISSGASCFVIGLKLQLLLHFVGEVWKLCPDHVDSNALMSVVYGLSIKGKYAC